jgi:hypothetical protein
MDLFQLFQLKRDIPSVGPDTIFTIGGVPLVNTTLMSILIVGVVSLACFLIVMRWCLAVLEILQSGCMKAC